LIAEDAGYFAARGLNVSINQVSASAAIQGVISGLKEFYDNSLVAAVNREYASELFSGEVK
jgi:hypothetical protein